MNSKKPDPNSIGRRIRALRRQQHLTQAQLALQVGIRTGPLNTLENGHHLPSVPVLCKLAEVLHTDVGQLLGSTDENAYILREDKSCYEACRTKQSFTTDFNHDGAFQARIIRFAPTKPSLNNRDIARLDKILTVILALEDICGAPKKAKLSLSVPLPRTESGLIRFASRIRSLFGIGDNVIFDYVELFESVGLRVVFLPLPNNIESLSFYDRDCENAFFFIDETHSVERQLFGLAYELGRIYLYNGRMAPKQRIGKLDAKHAAKRFAAFFLMPDEAVYETVRQTGVSSKDWNWEMLMRIKHRFGVSAESFLYRLEELNLITPQRKKELKCQIYKHYENTGNTEPDRSRRHLSQNGRLGDLLLSAELRQPNHPELPVLRSNLSESKIKF